MKWVWIRKFKKVIKLTEKYRTKLFGMVSNMNIASKRRDFLQNFDCFICNQQEAGILFLDDYTGKDPEQMQTIVQEKFQRAGIPSMVITMGEKGAVYATAADFALHGKL